MYIYIYIYTHMCIYIPWGARPSRVGASVPLWMQWRSIRGPSGVNPSSSSEHWLELRGRRPNKRATGPLPLWQGRRSGGVQAGSLPEDWQVGRAWGPPHPVELLGVAPPKSSGPWRAPSGRGRAGPQLCARKLSRCVAPLSHRLRPLCRSVLG